MPNPRVFPGRLSAVACAAVLVLGACGSNDSSTIEAGAPLPIAGDASRSAGESTMAMDDAAVQGDLTMLPWAPIEFVADDDLPSMGEERPAFAITPDADQIATLAGRLQAEVIDFSDRSGDGQDAESARGPLNDPDGSVSSDDVFPDPEPTLTTSDGVSWYYFNPSAHPDAGIATCDVDGICTDNSDETPASTTAAEAEAAARALLDGIGLGLEDATVAVTGEWGTWNVTVHYRVNGHDITDLGAAVSVGEDAEIVSAWGMAGTLENLGTYPTLDTAGAIDRMNDGWYIQADNGRMPVAAMPMPEPAVIEVEPAPPLSTDGAEPDRPVAPGGERDLVDPPDAGTDSSEEIPPSPGDLPDDSEFFPMPMPDDSEFIPMPEPMDPPDPVIVTLSEVTWSLGVFHSWDGSGVYLVPAYSFIGDDDNEYSVLALPEDMIAAPEAVDLPGDMAPLPSEIDGSSGDGVSGSSGSGSVGGSDSSDVIEPGKLDEPGSPGEGP